MDLLVESLDIHGSLHRIRCLGGVVTDEAAVNIEKTSRLSYVKYDNRDGKLENDGWLGNVVGT